jgi:hypothetical protein
MQRALLHSAIAVAISKALPARGIERESRPKGSSSDSPTVRLLSTVLVANNY